MNKKTGRLRVEDARRRNLTRLKSELQLQWKEVAKLLGVTPSRLSHIMNAQRPFNEKTARIIESALNLPAMSLDRDAGNAERITDSALRKRVKELIDTALSASGRRVEDVSEELYVALVEVIYADCKATKEVDAGRVGRLVREILRKG